MNKRADVVVIGGGLIGFSVAWHLLELGEEDVLVVEREPGAGMHSTGKSAGGFRAQFTSKVNIEMSLLSIPRLVNFPEEIHPDAYVRQVGYLFMASTEEQMDNFRENVELQRECGLDTVEIYDDPEKLRQHCEHINTDGLEGGTYSSSDGYFDPYEVMRGYQARFKERGGRELLDTAVTDLVTEAGEVAAVQTEDGEIECRDAVIAAGAWSAQIAEMAGVSVRIDPIPRKLLDTEPFPAISMDTPMLIDLHSGFYMRPDSGNQLLMGWADEVEPAFEGHVSMDWKLEVIERGLKRFPVLEDAEMRDGWAGLYDTTPDHHAIIDQLGDYDNLWMAAGFSGHGAMHSPAAGLLTAEWIRHGETKSLDISSLSHDRFEKGEEIEERNVI